jgi:hypothetical protein
MFGANLFGETNRRQRFQQREQWAAKQPGLLARDNRHGARITKEGTCRDGGVGSAATTLLSLYEISNCLALTRMLMRAGDRIPPGRRIVRVPREKVGDA